jgi:hypothetical protein
LGQNSEHCAALAAYLKSKRDGKGEGDFASYCMMKKRGSVQTDVCNQPISDKFTLHSNTVLGD